MVMLPNPSNTNQNTLPLREGRGGASLSFKEGRGGASILILSTFSRSGGAAIAANRLMNALNKNGMRATMLCRKNITWGPKALRKQSWTSIWERLVVWINNGFSRKGLWAVDIANCGQDILHTKEYQEADVIHLHWVNQGFLSLSAIEQMARSGKKIVWTMHDAWNSMAIHHLKINEDNSMQCLSKSVWKKKKKLYDLNAIQFVTCSKWLQGEALNSELMKSCSVVSIPNPIDTSFYKPMDKAEARRILGLPQDRKLVLFVAQRVDNPFKGMNYLPHENVAWDYVMMGSGEEKIRETLRGATVHSLGYVSDAERIRLAYSAADAFVLPSLSENLPNTIMESMACGTPSVGFKVGGIPEMIDHERNGYVAEYKDSDDLRKGIEYVLERDFSKECREKVMECFSEESVVRRYVQLYSQS